MKDIHVIILVAAATLVTLTTAEDNLKAQTPEGKLISTFQIVRFPNEACTGSTATRNGTCYTSAECSDKGGTSSGSCADGFGVCCIFVITQCGMSSSENITYWDAPTTVESGECQLTINPISDNICQLRLDFLTFVITGPQTDVEIGSHAFGSFIPGGAAGGVGADDATEVNWSTNCLTDSFSVSSPNPANKPPVLCGIISGEHMYVDMDSDHSNVLSFLFLKVAGPAVAMPNTKGPTSLAARDWDITILQYECGYINQAPPGCTQYYWADTGTRTNQFIQSYNFQASGSKHLANQDQRICIRREKSVCWAAFYLNTTTGTFKISGKTNGGALIAAGYTNAGQPCGYAGELGTGMGNTAQPNAFDCVIIPGAFALAIASTGVKTAITAAATQVRAPLTTATTHSPFPPQIGGSNNGFTAHPALDGTALPAGDATAYTIFTQHEPFTLIFKSDGGEGMGKADGEFLNAGESIGFKLTYDLVGCTA